MDIYLYNTLTGGRDLFTPIHPEKVSMYHCGPTVYNYAHIGNFRSYTFGDILRRMFEYNGYEVSQVMNITDVDDKTIRDSVREGISLTDFTRKYEKIFLTELEEMHILRPLKLPRATDSIPQMIDLIETLLSKNVAYKTGDGIYFSINKSKDYGALAGLKHNHAAETNSGHRIRTDEYDKENVQDFALWKFHTVEDGDVCWETPFGKGRPGWHIECSAMAIKNLGETLDIHTGGTDLIFPHHTNEIAQSEAATGKQFVHYWLHGGFLLVDSRKMSKSANNFFTLPDLKEKGITPLAYRYWLLTAHYRTVVNFTEESVRGAQTALNRLLDSIRQLTLDSEKESAAKGEIDKGYQALFHEAVNDDLNTPKAVALIWDILRDINISAVSKLATIFDFDRILGLNIKKIADNSVGFEIPEDIKKLIDLRNAAREAKEWKLSDDLRTDIEQKGFDVKDTAEGTQVIPKR
ncbi:MAG: cysteine--tRNA ligase [Patescibacteria group bacterium]